MWSAYQGSLSLSPKLPNAISQEWDSIPTLPTFYWDFVSFELMQVLHMLITIIMILCVQLCLGNLRVTQLL